MCAQPSSADARSAQGDGHAPNSLSSNGFEAALKDLAAAATDRKVEPICAGYLAVRAVSGGLSAQEMLDAVAHADNGSLLSKVVSAFSHRHCYMCDDGTAVCDLCDGAGALGGGPCPQCHGLTVQVCGFCRGTCWSDREQVPWEIRPTVLKRQIAHVTRDVDRLKRLRVTDLIAARNGDPRQRRILAAWLLRLQARLADLAATLGGKGPGPAKAPSPAGQADAAAHFGQAAAAVEKVLAALRQHGAK